MAYKKYKENARSLLKERLEFFNTHYGLRYGRVAVKNHKSRWGSCSSKKNLNFNYRIIFLPPELRDYIVVHELCHVREFNHSKKFWSAMAETLPDCGILRARIRNLS